MSWQNQFDVQLERIAATRDLGRGPVTLSVQAPHGRLECELAAIDSIGCAFTSFGIHTDALAQATVDELKALGKSLTERLNYLLEPVSNLELDGQGFTLQLRSSPPERDDERRRYYELTARRDGTIRLCRYEKTGHQPRQLIPATVTREVLRRLAIDFDAAVSLLATGS
jgi:hypothetical protein